MKRGSTACLAAALHIPGDGSAKSAGRSIFSSLYPFSHRSLPAVPAPPRGKSRRIDDPDARYRPHVSVQSGLCLFLGSRLRRARKPSPASCFDLGECALNVNEGAFFFHDAAFHFAASASMSPMSLDLIRGVLKFKKKLCCP